MTTGNAAAFDAWLDRFFVHYYARRPVNATFTGVHHYDHLLPDCSPQGLAEMAAELRDLRAELAAIGEEGLSESQRHDRKVAAGYLEIQGWELDSAHFQRGNPAFYTGDGVFGIISLFQRDAEPFAARVAAAISRMHALPTFFDAARGNLTSAPAAWTDAAVRECDSAIAYFERSLATLAQERGIDDTGFLAAAKVARDAFASFQTWLREDLSLHPAESVAAGREAFDRYLALGHCLPPEKDAVWVGDYAMAQLRIAQAALRADAEALDPSVGWREQLAALADLHPSLDEYAGSFMRVWEAARQAAIDAELVTWPDYPIEYVPVPASDREAQPGLYYLWYRCPPPFGRPETHRYFVLPIDETLSPEERDRRLRSYNDSTIKLNHVVHHGGLGHHVQNYSAFRAESRIGKMAGVDCASRVGIFASGTLIEGWACYATDLMNEIGFLTPLESLAERHQRVRMAARAYVDVALHTGEFDLEDAVAFYTAETAMPEAAAKGEAVKNSMFPGAAMMYLIGIDAIHDLRRKIKDRDDDAFSLRAFHDRFISYGALPVQLIADSMLTS